MTLNVWENIEEDDIIQALDDNEIFSFHEGDGFKVIIGANSSDKIAFLDKEDFSGVEFERGLTEIGQNENSLYVKYSEQDDDIIEIRDYFTIENRINIFVIQENDYNLDWRKLPELDKYVMCNIVTDENQAIDGILNFIQTEDKDSTEFSDILIGDDTDNIIYGNTGDDFIYGYDGEDRLYGEDGKDTIVSGKGNDDIIGGDGNNTFVFKIGDGCDVIYDAKNGDTIEFLDVEFKDLKFEKVAVVDDNGNTVENKFNLKITYGDLENPDTVLVKNFSFNKEEYENNIDKIVTLKKNEQEEEPTYDLQTFSILEDARIKIEGIKGSVYSEIITGTDKNDLVESGGGSDILTGGLGRNTFSVEPPASIDDLPSHVTIEDAKPDDTIKFTDTRFDELSFKINPDSKDLVITNGENSSVTVKNFLTGQKFFDRFLVLNENPESLTPYTLKSIAEDAQITVFMDKGARSYRGTNLNETITSTANDEYFTMGRGSNLVRIITDNLFGDDTIYLTKDEKLNIEFLETIEGELVQDFSFNATVSGNDVVFNHNKGTLTIKDAIIKDVGASIYVNDSDVRKRALINFDETNVNKKGEIKGSVLADFIDVEKYVSKNGKTGVKIVSGSGDDTIDGSSYNDTIIASFGDNTIYQAGGSNKITTGAGADKITLEGYSSNTVKAGAGANIINAQSFGVNKITTGADSDILKISAGSNTANLSNGENIVIIDGLASVNKITTGADVDTFDISAGINTVKTGKGDDKINIKGGYNVVTSSSTDRQKVIFTVFDGVNSLIGGKGSDKFVIKDDFYIDEEDVEHHTYGGKNYLNGGKGNDLYQVDKLVYQNSSVQIKDLYGSNTLVINQKLDVFFDVKLNKKTGKYTIGKTVTFTDGFDSDNDGLFDIKSLDTGVSVTGKNAKSIAYAIVDVDNTDEANRDYRYKFDVSKLASDVASWLSTSDYSSTMAVFDSGDKDVINSLLTVYKGDNGQTDLGSGQCYRNGVDITPYV